MLRRILTISAPAIMRSLLLHARSWRRSNVRWRPLAPGARHPIARAARCRLDAHREALCVAAVVHQLGHRAGADWADVTGCVTEGGEHRFVSIKDCLLAPHPDGKATRLGSLGSATHRSVKQVHAALSAQLVEPAHERR